MIARTLAARFACVSTTPFGRDVEPLVNCRKATSSRPTFTGTSSSREARSVSTATTFSRFGACAATEPSMRLISLDVRQSFAPLRSTMWSVFSR